ncbi:hypothetical protein EIKCOROL_01660 [Eikenella corrodens ATCC 23834]|uniref:Uncharacterized protein n=1 Tax=Eikenella corrodens ATCC 23834 TaxID=546274 RepID=C0DWA9_EIKCO|nr:hypothetical protein EIKCOROL_01660 [Eikenella corrodens ATCC 23834]
MRAPRLPPQQSYHRKNSLLVPFKKAYSQNLFCRKPLNGKEKRL